MTDGVLLALASALMFASTIIDRAAADAIAPVVLVITVAIAGWHLARRSGHG